MFRNAAIDGGKAPLRAMNVILGARLDVRCWPHCDRNGDLPTLGSGRD
jgi:hypothetical protein